MGVLHLCASDCEAEWGEALVATLWLRLMIPVAISLINNGVIVHHFLITLENLNLHATDIGGDLEL